MPELREIIDAQRKGKENTPMRIKIKANGTFEKMLLDYFEEFASDMLVEKINTGKKTLGGCWKYITLEAKKEAKEGCACVPDEKVFCWATHYFEEDDIKEQKTGAPVKVATAKAPALEENDLPEEKKDEKKEDYIDLSDFL